MKTAQEMLDYITDNNFIPGVFDSTYAKSLESIAATLSADEETVIVFIGTDIVEKASYVFALTNKRLIYAGQNWGQRILKSVRLQNLNDVSCSHNLGNFGNTHIVFDFYKEHIDVVSYNIDELYNVIMEFLEDYHSWARSSQSDSVQPNDVEMLKKYKQLLDEKIITQEEFEEKKRHILSSDKISQSKAFRPSKKYYSKFYYAKNNSLKQHIDITAEKHKLSIGTKIVLGFIGFFIIMTIIIACVV